LEALNRFAAHSDWTVATENGWRWLGLRNSGFIGSTTEATLRKVIAAVYEPKLAQLGLDPANGAYAKESLERSEMRARVVSLLAEGAKSPDVRKILDRAARDYLSGNHNALDVSYLDVALQVHAQEGGPQVAKAMFAGVIDSDDAIARNAVLSAVGHSTNPETTTWLLRQIMDPRVLEREKDQLLSALLGTPETRDPTFEWLKGRMAQEATTTRLTFWHSVAAAPFCSDEWREVQAMLTPLSTDPRRTLNIDRSLERMRDCAALRAAHGNEVAAALTSGTKLANN
jgi:hypothetical protein